jgi:hypothetical protein
MQETIFISLGLIFAQLLKDKVEPLKIAIDKYERSKKHMSDSARDFRRDRNKEFILCFGAILGMYFILTILKFYIDDINPSLMVIVFLSGIVWGEILKTRTNANYPNLSIGVTDFETIASSNFALIHFKIPGFDVDRYNLTTIAFLDLRSHLSFINVIATSSKFLFAVARLSNCHGFDLVATLSLHFSRRESSYLVEV